MDSDSSLSGGSQENTVGFNRTSQQRKLCYRELLNKVEAIQEAEDLGLQTLNDIGDILKEINVLDSESRGETNTPNADETLLDSMVLSAASHMLKKCVTEVDVFMSTYEPAELTRKLIQTITEGDEEEFQPTDILKLIENARELIPEMPDYRFLFGTFDLDKLPEPKQKPERPRVPKEKLQKTQPEMVTNVNREEQGIEQIIKMLNGVLLDEYTKNGEKPINYYDYIIDTDSFGNTVENMFYCSFLIRDGQAQIGLDPKGKPCIRPMKKRDLREYRDGGGVNNQMISNITYQDWEQFKKPGYLQKHKKKNSAT